MPHWKAGIGKRGRNSCRESRAGCYSPQARVHVPTDILLRYRSTVEMVSQGVGEGYECNTVKWGYARERAVSYGNLSPTSTVNCEG